MVINNPMAKDRIMYAITNKLWLNFNEDFAKKNIPGQEDIPDN